MTDNFFDQHKDTPLILQFDMHSELLLLMSMETQMVLLVCITSFGRRLR